MYYIYVEKHTKTICSILIDDQSDCDWLHYSVYLIGLFSRQSTVSYTCPIYLGNLAFIHQEILMVLGAQPF